MTALRATGADPTEPLITASTRPTGVLAELVRHLDGDTLRELAACADARYRRRFIDPALAAEELARVVAKGGRPTLGWWRRHLAPRESLGELRTPGWHVLRFPSSCLEPVSRVDANLSAAVHLALMCHPFKGCHPMTAYRATCPSCGHSWQSVSVSGRTRCNLCRTQVYVPAAVRRKAGGVAPRLRLSVAPYRAECEECGNAWQSRAKTDTRCRQCGCKVYVPLWARPRPAAKPAPSPQRITPQSGAQTDRPPTSVRTSRRAQSPRGPSTLQLLAAVAEGIANARGQNRHQGSVAPRQPVTPSVPSTPAPPHLTVANPGSSRLSLSMS